MSEEPIKKLIGSITYGARLEVLEKFEDLRDIFVRIELFDRNNKIREIIVDNFELLVHNITEFWDKEAKLPIYPRKMAAWLSDYLHDLGYPEFDFEYVYKAIMHRLGEEDELARLAKMLEIDPEVKPRMRKVDLDLPTAGRGAFLAGEIDKFLEETPKTTKSSIVYIDQDAKLSTLMTEQDIVQKSEETKVELITTTIFENPLDTTLNDVQINNVVPYHYRVMDFNTIGFEGIEPTKTLLDDGLQLTWVVPEIKPRQETKIEVSLERRISRTILMNIEEDVNIINTWFNIKPYKDRFSATDSFTNAQPDIIDNLIIEDEIPETFNLLEYKPPEEQAKMNMDLEGFEQLLKWQYEDLAIEKEIRHLYYLIDRKIFIFTQLLVKARENDTPILEINRLIEPNIRYYELVISYYLKFHKPIAELYIKEQIPEGINITFIFPQTIEKSTEIVKDKVNQVWKINPPLPSDRFEFGYIISGENIKPEFPIELIIPATPIISSTPLTSEFDLDKKPVYLPEMHLFLQAYKTTSKVVNA